MFLLTSGSSPISESTWCAGHFPQKLWTFNPFSLNQVFNFQPPRGVVYWVLCSRNVSPLRNVWGFSNLWYTVCDKCLEPFVLIFDVFQRNDAFERMLSVQSLEAWDIDSSWSFPPFPGLPTICSISVERIGVWDHPNHTSTDTGPANSSWPGWWTELRSPKNHILNLS